MDENDFNRQIRQARETFNQLELERAFIWDRSLPVSEDFRIIALDDLSSYSKIYKSGLSLSHYNILLKDYSYLQFSHVSEDSWRLAFMPNPWLAGVATAQAEIAAWEESENEGVLSEEDVSMLMDDMEYEARIPPIRFEYAKSQYKELSHPAAHFHIGRHYENRWASALRIGPYLFSLMILKLYYPERWAPRSRYTNNIEVADCLDEILIHSAGASSVVHDFSENERRSPHFGRNLVATAPPAAPARPRRR
jgi:hypothetical protein